MLMGRLALLRPSPSCSLTELLQLVSARRLTTVPPKPLRRMPARTPKKRSQMRFLGESVAAVASLLAAAMRRAPDVLAAPLVSPTSRSACQWPLRAALRQTVLLAAWRRASWPLHRKAVVPPPSAKRTEVTELPKRLSALPMKLIVPPMSQGGLPTKVTESPMFPSALLGNLPGPRTSPGRLSTNLTVPPVSRCALLAKSIVPLANPCARAT